MGLLAIRRTARIAVYFLLSGVFLIALFSDGMLERRIAHHRMTGGRPSLFAGLGFVPGGLIILSSVAALLPTVIAEWCFWVIPVLFGLAFLGEYVPRQLCPSLRYYVREMPLG